MALLSGEQSAIIGEGGGRSDPTSLTSKKSTFVQHAAIRSVAFLLLAGATAKLIFPIPVERLGALPLLAHPNVLPILSGIEFALGLILLIWASRRFALVLCIIVVSAFASINAWLVFADHSDCGCFGEFGVSPLVLLCLELSILVFIVVAQMTSGQGIAKRFVSPCIAAGVLVGVVVCVVGTNRVHVDRLAAVLDRATSRIQSQPLHVDRFIDAGRTDQSQPCAVEITNHSPDTIAIAALIGKQVRRAENLPLSIKPF